MSFISKGWGSEFIWESNDLYCGKFLNFKEGARFSMHFHKDKDETWYVLKGKFIVKYIDTKTSEVKEEELGMGATWRNKPLEPHQLYCLEEGQIIEVSTKDTAEDNYRVFPGDSQK